MDGKRSCEVGILSPSKKLFEKIDEEVSHNALKQDVISSIQYRENLIDRARKLLAEYKVEQERSTRKSLLDTRSIQIKKMIFALHNSSLCVVEAINSINLASQSIKNEEENINQGFLMSFSWMGLNYMTKMLTDFQFMSSFPEIMDILLPERKTLFRNPFLLPLDLDEIVGYEPDATCSTSKSKAARMSRISWKINIDRVKRAASRILFEEHRAICGDRNIIHVFPKVSYNTKQNDFVKLSCNELPQVNVSELKRITQSSNLTFDDAIIVACMRLFLSRDIEGLKIDESYISKESVYKLSKQPIQTITDELFPVKNKQSKHFIVKISTLWTIYKMLIRNQLKSEFMSIIYTDSIQQLKDWLMNIILKQWNPFRSFQTEGEEIKYFNQSPCHKKSANPKMGRIKSNANIDSGYNEDVENSESDKVRLHSRDINHDEGVTTQSSNECAHELPNKAIELSPIPIWKDFIAEGFTNEILLQGENKVNLSVGDIIRVGHPFQSQDYTILKVKTNIIVLNNVVHVLPTSRTRLLDIATEKPYSPKKNNCKAKAEVRILEGNDIQERIEQSSKSARVWKLVSSKDDRRLEWRKQFDNGFVPWLSLSLNKYAEYFKVKVEMREIERNCHDTLVDPDNSAHQQRLDYFEKVDLDEIILETFNTVCHSWHPRTPNIDNTKWAKLARNMKFLSNVKNANHEVDMAFLRHSHKRKLDLKRFKSVLLDMALRKYSSARYDGGEALANMLWTTVVTLPQVNRMIWIKAESMAVEVEVRRTCAQIRISALFRMWYQRRIYRYELNAVLCISKNVRRMIVKKKKALVLEKAEYYRFYRVRHYSAIVCQKYWRRFVCVSRFLVYKKMMNKRREDEVSKIWKELRRRGVEKVKNLVSREAFNVQSVLVIISMFLNDEILEDRGIKLEIKVYVPDSKSTFSFGLNENDVRESLEKFAPRKGPLSWNEMLRKDFLSKLKSRLMAKIVRGKPIITFCRRDLAEKGNLISRQLFANDKDLYIMSLYRSPYDIVVRLYHPESCEQLRTIIDMSLLIEWLIEDEEMRKKEALGILRIREIAQRNGAKTTDKTKVDLTSKRANDLPQLLRRDKQDDLANWLRKRIQVNINEENGQKKIILQYQAIAEFMERVAMKFQCIWRAKCAKKRAKQEVHDQYEKQFDWESRTFFYVHIKTGTRQWSKPSLLREDEDIKDPPDEWREVEHNDSETGESRKYYMNPFTGQTSWLSQDEAAQIVQKKFRQRQTELLLPSSLNFSKIVRAVSMIRDTELKYEQYPSKLSNRVNFALLCHCIRFDLDSARSLYKDAIVKSTQHPVIARAYGIFILATCKAPLTQTFEKACHLFKQAQNIDPDQKLFQTAKENFFYWAVVMNPNNGMALLNYALLHQCILGEYYRAEKIYIRALTQDPLNENIAQNFQLFQDQRYPGGYYERSGVPNMIVKRSNTFQESKEWGEWKKMVDPLSSKPKFNMFWLNILDKRTSFEEPDWKMVWLRRVQRSKRITTNTKALWVEYYDEQLHASFIHNRSSGQFVWQQ